MPDDVYQQIEDVLLEQIPSQKSEAVDQLHRRRRGVDAGNLHATSGLPGVTLLSCKLNPELSDQLT